MQSSGDGVAVGIEEGELHQPQVHGESNGGGSVRGHETTQHSAHVGVRAGNAKSTTRHWTATAKSKYAPLKGSWRSDVIQRK